MQLPLWNRNNLLCLSQQEHITSGGREAMCMSGAEEVKRKAIGMVNDPLEW